MFIMILLPSFGLFQRIYSYETMREKWGVMVLHFLSILLGLTLYTSMFNKVAILNQSQVVMASLLNQEFTMIRET
jgi:hypothetical protein